ncbi:MAG: TetR/AcrR family transcriptional regulator [Solirubrobacterales bacterium]
MENVRNKILAVAKELFMLQGYKQTGIRQIVDHSGVLTGSIYHFFRNKEEILKTLLLDVFDMSQALVAERLGKDASPGLHLAVVGAMELVAAERNEHICEMYYASYSANTILESIVCRGTTFTQELFGAANPSFTDDDYYVRTLAVKGIISSFISSRYLNRKVSLIDRVEVFVEMAMKAFNLEQDEIERIKTDTVQLLGVIDEMAGEVIREQLNFKDSNNWPRSGGDGVG